MINEIKKQMAFNYKNHPHFSMISSQLTEEHNPASHAQLKADLESHGYKPVEAIGHYGNTEKSFFVPHSGSDVDKKNIENLGNKYNQESVLHSSNETNHLAHLKDPSKSLFGQGSSNDFSDNYFTEFHNGQKMKLRLGNIESLKKSEDSVLYHYSKVKGLKQIDPSFHGTGTSGEESKRGNIIPRTYYYDTPVNHERRVSAPSQSLYTIKKPERILDIASPEATPLREKAKNQYGNIDLSDLEVHIKDAGYHGYKNSASNLPNAVALFHPHPVVSEKLTKMENDQVLSTYHYCQAIEALQKGEDFLALHHAKKALDLGMECDELFEVARSNLRMEKNLAIELLNKGEIGNALKALGFAAALSTGAYHYQDTQPKPIEQVKQNSEYEMPVPQISKEQIVKDKTLRAISAVESGNNPDAKHHLMSTGLNKGTRALGSYGLMPLTIKETIKKDPELNKRYGHIVGLKGDLFNAVVKDEPQLEHKVASKLYDNLAQKFGHHPERIGHAWFNGVSGTVKALQQGKDLNRHWHVKKIMKEYVK